MSNVIIQHGQFYINGTGFENEKDAVRKTLTTISNLEQANEKNDYFYVLNHLIKYYGYNLTAGANVSRPYINYKPRNNFEVHLTSQNFISRSIYGSANDCKKQLDNINFNSYLNKIIRFDYNGGSTKGCRVVKVTKIDEDKIFGTDIVKNVPRSYLVSKITNIEEVK